jgi:hypothetical protein
VGLIWVMWLLTVSTAKRPSNFGPCQLQGDGQLHKANEAAIPDDRFRT